MRIFRNTSNDHSLMAIKELEDYSKESSKKPTPEVIKTISRVSTTLSPSWSVDFIHLS
jgi:hypothetical protein